MGIVFTEKGLKLCEEMILKAYYDPEKREEIEKITRVLGIDLQKIKDSFLKSALKNEEKTKIKISISKFNEIIKEMLYELNFYPYQERVNNTQEIIKCVLQKHFEII